MFHSVSQGVESMESSCWNCGEDETELAVCTLETGVYTLCTCCLDHVHDAWVEQGE